MGDIVKICTYCRRESDDEIEECPYCGASEFTKKNQDIFVEESDPVAVEPIFEKKASLIYRIIKYILVGIFFYFLILVILAFIVLIYVVITGNVPGFLLVESM